MNSRERVKCALNHETPDRVVVDFGSTAVTGMHVTCVAQLRDRYGLESRPVKVCEPYQMLGEIEEDLLDALGIDTVALPSPQHSSDSRTRTGRPSSTPAGPSNRSSLISSTPDSTSSTPFNALPPAWTPGV